MSNSVNDRPNQDNNRGLLTAVLVALIVLVIVLMIAVIFMLFLVRDNYINKIPPTGEVVIATQLVLITSTDEPYLEPSNTPQPTFTPDATYTAQPTYTPVPTETPVPSLTVLPTKTRTSYVTPVFMYNVDEVLYLDSSIYSNNLWNPDHSTPSVEESDRVKILQLVENAQEHREKVWQTEDYSDLDLYNHGWAITQLQDYYDYYIDPADGCYKDVDIVDGKFYTIIIAYDGLYARTMTMKVESRNTICNGSSAYWIYNDSYAYELKMQKFGDVWKIIEYPLGGDPSQ